METAFDAVYEGQVLATRWQRFVGIVVDNFLLMATGAIGAVAGVGLAHLMGYERPDSDEAVAVVVIAAVVVVVLFVAIQAILITRTGQSIGKRLIGTRIVDANTGSRVGFWRAVVARWFVPVGLQTVPTIGGFFGLADAVTIFGSSRRCLHDFMAGTRVIQA